MRPGTDTAGSIRIPAAFCGVAGLKPTYGLVERAGIQPLGFSLDHIGPIARTVGDVRISFEAMSGGVPRKPAPPALKDIRIGLPKNFYFTRVAADVSAAVHKAAAAAEQLGARVIPVRVPDVDALNAAGRVILLAEASALYAPYLHRRDKFGMHVLALLDQGRLVPAIDYVNSQPIRQRTAAD